MEMIVAVLTDKQEPFVGAIGITGMSKHRADEATVVGIYLDCHTLMQEGFIGDHGVQFSKGPLGIGGIGLSLLPARLLAFTPFRPFSDVLQVFQSNQTVWVLGDDAFGDDMIGG